MSSIISTISNAISGDSSSSAAPVRWGICGTGKIGHDFATAISSLKDVQIVAVGSRTQKEADDFADKFKIPRRHASYEALAKDVEVDIVYVCTPNSEHAANCILLMQHGRAVVCEKPFMVNRAEAVAVKEAAKKYNALCMEGMWTRFMPVQTKVKELLAEQKIGEVKYVSIHIGFPADSMLDTPEKNKELLDRVKKTELGGGAILDVGSYAASFAQWILGQPTQGPTKISAMGKLDQSGVDQSGTFIMQYGSDKYAQAMMSSEFNTSDNAIIMGSKGYIDIAMPWQASDKLTVYIKETDKTEEHKFKITPTPKENYPNTSLFQYEAKHMNELFRAGKKESDIMTLEESCVVMGILDEIRKQVGVKLENDNKAPPAAGPKASL